MNKITKNIHKWFQIIRQLCSTTPYEPEVFDIIYKIVKPGWICADVGSNLGIVSRVMARQVGPDGRVIAFEAFPENVKLSAFFNRLSGHASTIQTENIAISDGMQSEVNLFPGRDASYAEWNIVGHDVNGRETKKFIRVPATSLDNYFPPGSTLDFVKIDIEGAEALALRGMRRILTESRPVIVIEFHDEAGWAGREELLNAKYDLFDIRGEKLDPEKDTNRIYHCFAYPRESMDKP